ncbi:MAG: hypothetical protein IPP69_15705 [Flavobacteriales bacterium]|nr:hypothetical protein [Flavobacteriales bacterium]
MYTTKQALAYIQTAMGINPIDYKCTMREMFFVDTKTGKATFNNALPSADERINMTLNTSWDSIVTNTDGSVTLRRTMKYSGKNYQVVTTLTNVGGMKIRISNYMQLFDQLISANQNTNLASISQARTKFNMAGDTIEDVIHTMATATSTYNFDPYEFASGELTIQIMTSPGTKAGRLKLTGTLHRNGSPITHDKMRWEVWPGTAPTGLPNTTSNRNASAQFPTSNSFEITTDLRDRTAYPIMGSGEIRVVCMASTKESDGDVVQVLAEKIISSPVLQTFNYFGL